MYGPPTLHTKQIGTRYPQQLEENKPLIADGGAFAPPSTIEVDRDDRARRRLLLSTSAT